ncbi:hypothetical protein B0H11DRAFT_2375492 [Mycena galericulata]|nr:hypothetical protein B0H11DRAFT_2375492 [Mycena galericulata]
MSGASTVKPLFSVVRPAPEDPREIQSPTPALAARVSWARPTFSQQVNDTPLEAASRQTQQPCSESERKRSIRVRSWQTLMRRLVHLDSGNMRRWPLWMQVKASKVSLLACLLAATKYEVRDPHDLRLSDIFIERFVAWKAIVKQLIAYFEGVVDIQKNTAKELTKFGAAIQVPFRAGSQFLGEGGLQGFYYDIRDKTRVIADQHANLERTIDSSINVQHDTGKLATNLAKERELSTHLIAELSAFKNTPMAVTSKTDPYVANTAVVRQLTKQVHEANLIIMQQNSAHFEEGIVRAIQRILSSLHTWPRSRWTAGGSRSAGAQTICSIQRPAAKPEHNYARLFFPALIVASLPPPPPHEPRLKLEHRHLRRCHPRAHPSAAARIKVSSCLVAETRAELALPGPLVSATSCSTCACRRSASAPSRTPAASAVCITGCKLGVQRARDHCVLGDAAELVTHPAPRAHHAVEAELAARLVTTGIMPRTYGRPFSVGPCFHTLGPLSATHENSGEKSDSSRRFVSKAPRP